MSDKIEVPPQLAQKLNEETERYSRTTGQAATEHEEAAARHEAIVEAVSEKGRAEVEHAKEVAAKHRESLEAKRKAIESNKVTLLRLEEMLAATTAREEELKRQLGD